MEIEKNDAIKIDHPGVFDVPEDVYHADNFLPEPSLSSSGARALLPPKGVPAKFWYNRTHPQPTKKIFSFGKAAHQLLLEPDEWHKKFEVLPANWNARTNAGKEFRASIEAEGKTAITNAEWETIEGMHKALAEHEFAMEAFKNGASEKTLVWKDPETGIWCRVRPDFFPHNHPIVADYKTARSSEPTEDIPKSMYDYGYYQQADWYLSGIRELGLIEKPRFLFIYQEKEPPYLVTCATPSETALHYGEVLNRKARSVFKECLQANHWPGYTDKIVEVDIPKWAEYRLEGRKQDHEFDIKKEIMAEAYEPHGDD